MTLHAISHALDDIAQTQADLIATARILDDVGIAIATQTRDNIETVVSSIRPHNLPADLRAVSYELNALGDALREDDYSHASITLDIVQTFVKNQLSLNAKRISAQSHAVSNLRINQPKVRDERILMCTTVSMTRFADTIIKDAELCKDPSQRSLATIDRIKDFADACISYTRRVNTFCNDANPDGALPGGLEFAMLSDTLAVLDEVYRKEDNTGETTPSLARAIDDVLDVLTDTRDRLHENLSILWAELDYSMDI